MATASAARCPGLDGGCPSSWAMLREICLARAMCWAALCMRSSPRRRQPCPEMPPGLCVGIAFKRVHRAAMADEQCGHRCHLALLFMAGSRGQGVSCAPVPQTATAAGRGLEESARPALSHPPWPVQANDVVAISAWSRLWRRPRVCRREGKPSFDRLKDAAGGLLEFGLDLSQGLRLFFSTFSPSLHSRLLS